MEGIKNSLNNMSGGKLPMFAEEPACAQYCPNLTFQQRVIGFAASAGVGWLMSFMGVMTLIGGPTASNMRIFIALYVLGNVSALCATGFLLGPRSQCRQMFHPTRRYTTIIYLSLLIIVFAVAVAKQNIGIVIVLLLFQICAGFWYSISYIPFGRKMVTAVLRRSICKPCFEAYDEMKGSAGGGGGGSSFMGGNKGFTVLSETV